MKQPIIFLLLICIVFSGCVIPCEIYFRNLSGDTVTLQGKLNNRRFFNKLPNKVNYYEIPGKNTHFPGTWKYQALIYWIDSATYSLDIPSNMAIDLGDISNGLTLGTASPDVVLVALQKNKSDTITKGDYGSVAAKFKVKHRVFSKPVYYYDLQ